MTLPPNVDKSPFMPGTYVIYDGKGYAWRAARMAPARPGGPASRHWRARPAPNHPARTWLVDVFGDTLKGIADVLAQRGAACRQGQPRAHSSGASPAPADHHHTTAAP